MLKAFWEKIGKFIEGNKISGIVIGLISFALIVSVSFTSAYKRFDLNLYDLNFAIKPKIPRWDRLSFVDIDDNSTNVLGQFPWPRYLYGKAMRSLKEVRTTLSALDIMFPDPSAFQVSKDDYERIKGKTKLTGNDVKEIIINNDQLFAAGIKNMGKAVLSYSMIPEPLTKTETNLRQTAEFRQAQNYFFEKATKKVEEKDYYKYEGIRDSKTVKIAYPIPELMKAAHTFGFVNRDTDIDGAVRKVRLVQFFEGRLYFNLALVMLANACGVTLNNIDIIVGERIVLKDALHPLTHEKGDINIPIDKNGMMYVYWVGDKREQSFKIVPFYGLVEYPDTIGHVNEWLERLAGPAELMLAEQERQEMDAARDAYNRAETAAERRELRARIVELMQLDRERKESLKEIFREETENLEDAGKYDNIISGIDVVLAVESLRDNITVTGLTATGTVDIGQTPLEQEFAMVGVYHNTINTIVQGKHIYIAAKWLNYIMIFFIALFMGFMIQKLSAKKSILAIIVSFLFFNVAVIFTFIFGNIWLDLLGSWLACLVPSASIAATKLVKEESQKHFIKSAFGHYLSPSIIDKIVESPDSLELGGEEKEITIFFSDVAKFSTISEKLTPHELVSLLNEYLSEMTDIILDSGGTIDKYEGDAIIAFFGAPQAFEDHALRCCMAAIEQKKRLAVMQEEWRKIGKDVLSIRIGINTGVAVIGNMGSRTRFNYTMIGDSVNLAARIEGANKAYNTCAMITGSTYEYVKDTVEARKLDIIRVVGKKEPVPVYELLDVKGALSDNMYELLDKYGKGLEFYNTRQWKKAQDEFKKALKIIPDDGPSRVYAGRCGTYLINPPPKDWKGVFQLVEK